MSDSRTTLTDAEREQVIDTLAMLARRLPECVTAKTVRKGEPKRCSVTGKMALTWYPKGE